ncbi:hypothetical protein BsWGS_27591 [Bradybaena similaris]
MEAADHFSSDTDNEETSPLLRGSADRRNGEITYDTNTNGSDIQSSATLERPEDYTSRWRSIRLMYLVMFLGSVTFTITMSSLWPFLQVLNPAASTSFLGWVVAAYSLGQLVASPCFGGWANLRSSSREPLTVSLMLTILSNVFYMYLESLPFHRDYFMILARGLIGFSAGNVAVVRSYVAGTTTVQERTACMANLSIFQAMGFILGPVIQAALVPISYPGPVHNVYFHLSMYTAPALLAACVATISLILLIFMFKEHRVYDDDVRSVLQNASTDIESSQNGDALSDSLKQLKYKPDYVAVFCIIFLFYGVLFMFTVFETIATPLTMDMYAWSKSKATLYQGFILGAAGVLSIIVFMLVKILAKKYNERYLLLGGFTFCLLGYFTLIPWGSQLPPIGIFTINDTVSSSDTIFALSDYVISGNHSRNTALNTHRMSKRSFDSWHPEFIHNFNIPVFGEYNSTYHVKNRDNMYDSHTGIAVDTNNISDIQDKLFLGFNLTTEASASSTTSLITNSTTSLITNSTPSLVTNSTSLITNSTPSLVTNSTASPVTNSTVTPNGCPYQYEWCRHVPVIYLAQFLGGTVLISIGYPVCNMLSYTLYSKVLGPKPQGLWMGWLTASGSLARVLGPIYVSQVYNSFGPQITFGSCCGFIALTIVFYLIVFRRLVPFSFKDESLTQYGGSAQTRHVN